MELVKEQTNANRYFLFELAWNAWPEIVRVVRDGVQIVEGHMCFGPQAVSTSGCAKLVWKPTGWMTNSSWLAVAVSHRCSNMKLPLEEHREHSETS